MPAAAQWPVFGTPKLMIHGYSTQICSYRVESSNFGDQNNGKQVPALQALSCILAHF